MSPHLPRKRFGQNFLQDPRVIYDIVDAVYPVTDDVLLEIGPGLGALTRPLLERVPHLHVLEIDRDIIARLKREFSPERLTIHEGDALAFDFSRMGSRFRIVGNLPYNISTPLLFHLANYADRVIDMHFMLQKEVVERMVATPDDAHSGRLSIMLQYRFEMEKIIDVPPEAFYPPPKVDSAVVRMTPHAVLPYPADDIAILGDVVLAAFSQRRKTLRNSLRDRFTDAEFADAEIDPGLRAEALSLDDFVRMANVLARRH